MYDTVQIILPRFSESRI